MLVPQSASAERHTKYFYGSATSRSGQMKDSPNILQTGRDIVPLDNLGFFGASIKVSF
jgi:hypothetical protein